MPSSDEPSPRQRIVRVRGARRAKLTPVPGTDPDPELPVHPEKDDAPTSREAGAPGPNDAQLLRDVPPHY